MPSSLTHSRLDFVAKCAAGGMPTDQIARCASLSADTVLKLVRGGHDERFDALYQGWSEKNLQLLADHRYRLQEFLDDAYRGWGDSIKQTNDLKLRYLACRDLIVEVFGSRANSDVNVNLGFQQNNVNVDQVNVAVGDIAATFAKLATELGVRRVAKGPDPHEHVGDEALPGSYKIVAEAERRGAQPVPGKLNGGTAEPEPLEGTPIVGTPEGRDP